MALGDVVLGGDDGFELEEHAEAVDRVDSGRIETDLDFPDRHDGGPIRIRRASEFVGSTAIFVEAARAAGFRWLPDLNAEPVGENTPPGVGAVPSNIVDGVRSGPGAAFLEPVMNRPNLTVHTATRTVRVRLTGTRAVGITAGASAPEHLVQDVITAIRLQQPDSVVEALVTATERTKFKLPAEIAGEAA